MYKKKIALTCAAFATAGMLLTGCATKKDGLNTEMRKEVYKALEQIPQKEYTVPEKDCEITAKSDYGYFVIGPSPELEVKIENKKTGDVLRMVDNRLNGIDYVTYNGVRGSTEGLDKRFDEALEKLKPRLDNYVQKEIHNATENTKLNSY